MSHNKDNFPAEPPFTEEPRNWLPFFHTQPSFAEESENWVPFFPIQPPFAVEPQNWVPFFPCQPSFAEEPQQWAPCLAAAPRPAGCVKTHARAQPRNHCGKDDISTIKEEKHVSWCPSSEPRHQSLFNFRNDMLQNAETFLNSNCFADWLHPPEEVSSQTFAKEALHWGTDSMSYLALGFPLGRVAVGQGKLLGLENRSDFGEWDKKDDMDTIASSVPVPAPKKSPPYSATASATIKPSEAEERDRKKPSNAEHYTVTQKGIQSTYSKIIRQRKRVTIEQKRSNHIRYEKKRRSLINQGFSDLVELIPGLVGRTWPKSTVLFETISYLQDLIQVNEALEIQAVAANKFLHIKPRETAPPRGF